MLERLSLAMLVLTGSALAQGKPAETSAPVPKVEMTAPVFEMFRLVPGQEQMADHIHFEATGPTTAEQWLEELDRQRAEMREEK